MCSNSMNILNWSDSVELQSHIHIRSPCVSTCQWPVPPLGLLSHSPPAWHSSVCQPCNCGQLPVSKLSTWLHIIFPLSVRILTLIEIATCQSAWNCLLMNQWLISAGVCVCEESRVMWLIRAALSCWDWIPCSSSSTPPFPLPPPLSSSFSLTGRLCGAPVWFFLC